MAVGDAYVFPGFLTPVLKQLFVPKPATTFLTCFCRGERQKYAGKKSCLILESNSQPPGQESDTLTTEPPLRDPNKHEILRHIQTMMVECNTILPAYTMYRQVQYCTQADLYGNCKLPLYHTIPSFNKPQRRNIST